MEDKFVGVQCKGNHQGYGDKVTEGELRSEALFTAIFATFRKVQPDRDLELITNMIFAAVQEFIRSRFIRQFCDSLLQSTSLKPVEAIADEGRQIQSGVIGQIGQTLGRALQKASGSSAGTMLPDSDSANP